MTSLADRAKALGLETRNYEWWRCEVTTERERLLMQDADAALANCFDALAAERAAHAKHHAAHWAGDEG